MNTSYEYIVTRCVRCWSSITKQTLIDMFERADGMCCNLTDFREWLMKKPITSQIKKLVMEVYVFFRSMEEKAISQKAI